MFLKVNFEAHFKETLTCPNIPSIETEIYKIKKKKRTPSGKASPKERKRKER
jgi:hypothetical protein